MSSPMMAQSAWILTTACPKPAVPFESCQREYGRVTCSASPQRFRYTGPSSFPRSGTVQRPCLFLFFSEADEGLHPWHQMTRPRVKRRSPQESQPAQHRSSPSCFRCSCTGLALSQGWKTYVCPKQSSSASSKKERAIVVLQKSVTKGS